LANFSSSTEQQRSLGLRGRRDALHDLRPLSHTQMGNTLRLDREEANRESSTFREPLGSATVSFGE
jgi:hypothetical protein